MTEANSGDKLCMDSETLKSSDSETASHNHMVDVGYKALLDLGRLFVNEDPKKELKSTGIKMQTRVTTDFRRSVQKDLCSEKDLRCCVSFSANEGSPKFPGYSLLGTGRCKGAHYADLKAGYLKYFLRDWDVASAKT